MSTLSLPPEELLVHTLGLLEWRLKRLEFLLYGAVGKDTADKVDVLSRLLKLDQSLFHLVANSETLSELLEARAVFPHLFPSSEDSRKEDAAEQPSTSQKLSMILAEAPTYSSTASQLRSLNDVTLPSSQGFANLAALQPRIAEVAQRQYEQAMEISELRRRSGLAVLRWHEVFVLGLGRCWADWDTRLRDAERDIRREERRAEEDG